MTTTHPNATPVTLKTLLAEYPVTHALRTGQVSSSLVSFDFAPYEVSNHAFKPFVRDLAFDAGELAIATFLQAKAHGKPLVLVPAVISGRFQHHGIAYNSERTPDLKPKDLEGKRVGVRAYTQTSGVWVRGILQNQYGVDLDRVTWVCFEDAHVAEHRDPHNVVRVDDDKKLKDMLLDGEVEAAIVGSSLPDDPRIQTLIPDAKNAGKQWSEQSGFIPINHMFVITEELSRNHPEVVQEVYKLLKASKKLGIDETAIDTRPYGVEANRKSLEEAIKYCEQQGLLSHRMSVDELFDDTTRHLN